MKTKPLAKPAPPACPLTPDAALLGPRVTPIEHLQLMSAGIFENLVCEWVASLGEYARIEQLAGSGDSGLDVVGFVWMIAFHYVVWGRWLSRRVHEQARREAESESDDSDG